VDCLRGMLKFVVFLNGGMKAVWIGRIQVRGREREYTKKSRHSEYILLISYKVWRDMPTNLLCKF
jgi:deoxyadenosine/deoxycytidine kinase